jgi:toxin CptA
MSSPKYASPLYLKPETSRIFVALFLTGHLGAMASVLLLNFSWELKAALLIILAISLVVVLRGRGIGNVSSLTWKDGGEWALKLDNGTEYETQLLPSSYVNPWLVVLNFHKAENNRGRSVTLFRDALDPESFRRLRVRLGVEKASDQ